VTPALARSLLVCLLLILPAVTARAVSGSFYAAEVPVNSQADAERTEALKSALAQVVIRISGNPSALARADVAKQVAGAASYVQQFQYRQEVVNDNGQPLTRLFLSAQFDREGVDQMLRSLGLLAGVAPSAGEPIADSRPGVFHVWISGLHSAQDYARVMGAIGANEGVRDAVAEQTRGDGMQVRLSLAGALQRWLDGQQAGGVLRVTNAKPPVDGVDALLSLNP
jgi:Uncharacterized protein conserved in bacteria (DUF2066)